VNVGALRRFAVDSALRLVRLPLDTMIGLLPSDGESAAAPRATAKLALDRADGTVRAILGNILGDPVLREDAQNRYAAADERERALRLRGEAEWMSEAADERLDQRHEQSERERKQAQQRAKAQREETDRKRREKTDRAAEVDRERLAASNEAAVRAREEVSDKASEERLEALESKAAALAQQEQALTARDEARRLRDAASRAKAERKGG